MRGRNVKSGGSSNQGSNYPLSSKGTRGAKLRLDDEIALRSQAVGGEESVHSGNDSDFDRHIHVKTDVRQVVDE